MVCWSCEKNTGEGVTCGACGAVQPPDRAADHFRVLGAERRFAVDLEALERRYKELTRILHPDRFARADARARRASMARTVQLNEAWRTLRDPVRRAEYLLSLAGVEVGGEEGTKKQGERVPVPQALLMEVLELREGLADAKGKGNGTSDAGRVDRMTADVQRRRDEAMATVASSLDAADHDAAAAALVAVRYYDRFLEEATVPEAAHA